MIKDTNEPSNLAESGNCLKPLLPAVFSDINVYDIGFIKAMKVKTFEDIENCKRLFLGELINHSKRTGMFVEIRDVKRFIEVEKYSQKNNIKHNCLEESYIEWHNFHVIL